MALEIVKKQKKIEFELIMDLLWNHNLARTCFLLETSSFFKAQERDDKWYQRDFVLIISENISSGFIHKGKPNIRKPEIEIVM